MSPYASRAQQRFFHSRAAAKAGLTKRTVEEWDDATSDMPGGFNDLPERVASKREAKKEARRRAAARALKGKY